MSVSNKEREMSKQLPCSLVVERALTVAGIERKAILSCGTDQHHIYCPAYYQNLIDDAEAALAECEFRCQKDHVPVATMKAMIDQIADLERKLAECERERIEAQDKIARYELGAWAENKRFREQVIPDLERKLAAAREALKAIVTFSIMAGETERDERFLKQINATAGDALKVLTEAGEGSRKELSFDKWADVEPILTNDEAGEGEKQK